VNESEPWDLCWLDCPEDGYLLVDGDREICLCPEHAARLRAGRFGGSYAGAPLPPDSMAGAWPWRDRMAEAA
jgi:hypothetical protein